MEASIRYIKVAVVVLLIGASAAYAAPPNSTPAEVMIDQEITGLQMYQSLHPDEGFRALGLRALDEGRGEDARRYFLRAARYADKPAQALYAQALWDGQGGSTDRALAYAWMDLAAERGYLPLVAYRERFWAELTAEERARALQEGAAVYAEYGDAVAKRRMELALRRGRATVTGSHTGFVRGGLKVYRSLGDVAGTPGVQITGSNGDSVVGTGLRHGAITHFWDPRYWQPVRYWQWQDQRWNPPNTGTVTVKPIIPMAPADSGRTEPLPNASDDPAQ